MLTPAPILPGMRLRQPEPLVADAVRAQIAALEAAGVMPAAYQARAADAIRAARRVDALSWAVKPYVQAEAVTACRAMLEKLPDPPSDYRAVWTHQLPAQDPDAGDAEISARLTVDYLAGAGALGDVHAGPAALVVATGRLIDRISPDAVSSGITKLDRAHSDCQDLLPAVIASTVTLDLLTRWVTGEHLTGDERQLIDDAFPPASAEWASDPEPTYAPARDEEWLSELPEIERVARAMGLALMPWQRRVLAVATEYRPGPMGQRCYHYKRVLLTVPRQSGKTTLLGPLRLHRLLTRRGDHMFSTAQTGSDARRRMKDLIGAVVTSPLAPFFRPRYSQGSEGLAVPGTGSDLTCFAPIDGALHGETPSHVDLDEIWKYSQDKGDSLLDGAIGPAQATIYDTAQTWMLSTMGTRASGFMNNLVDAGRAGAEPTLAFFEWSLRVGADPYSRAAWREFHPALGNTITEEALASRTNIAGPEWLRAYCNRLTDAEDPIIMLEDWDALAGQPHTVPALADTAIALEVAPSSAGAAVVAAWLDDDGATVVRVLHQAGGTAWVRPYLAALHDHQGVTVLHADGAGPVARFLPDLAAAGWTVQTLAMRDRGSADGAFLAAARDEETRLRHDGSPALRAAVSAAQLRTTNGVEILSRDHSLGPIPALIAASIAAWAANHHVDYAPPIA